MAVKNDVIFYDRSRLVGKSVGNARFFPDHFGWSEMPAFLVLMSDGAGGMDLLLLIVRGCILMFVNLIRASYGYLQAGQNLCMMI